MDQELKTRHLGMAAFLIAALNVLMVETSTAGGWGPHGWTVSVSTSDPYVLDAEFVKGQHDFAIWLVCTDDGPEAGLSLANLFFEMSGFNNVITAFTPAQGWEGKLIEWGSYTGVELTPPNGCVNGEILAGSLTVELSNPGNICLFGDDKRCDSYVTPIEWLGLNFGGGVCGSTCRACVSGAPLCWANETCTVNYSYCDEKGNCISTSNPCDCRAKNGNCGGCQDCLPSSIEPNTWGQVKASYR